MAEDLAVTDMTDVREVNESLAEDPVRNPFEMPWYFAMVYMILYSVVIAVAVVGNLCVVYIIVSNPSMRNVTNYFIVNLSISDATLALFNTFSMIYLMESNWLFGEWYCKVVQFLGPFLISASIFTYAAIATDRYMAIVHPLRPKLTSRQIIVTIVVIWLVSGAIGTPNFIHARLLYIEYDDRIVCTPIWPDGIRATSDKVYNIFLIVVNYVIPLIVVATTYSAVCRVLWGSKVVGETNERLQECVKAKRKLVKMMIFCVVIFATCWAPMHTYQVASYVSQRMITWKYINYVYSIIYLLAMSNTMYPPIVYCRLNAKFRYGFAHILKNCFCCCLRSDNLLDRPSLSNPRMSCMYQALPAGQYSKVNGRKASTDLLLPVSPLLAANSPRTSVRCVNRASRGSESIIETIPIRKKVIINYNINTKKIDVTTTLTNAV